MSEQQNIRWLPMTLREVVGLFALPQKKPPDEIQKANQPVSGGKGKVVQCLPIVGQTI